MVELQETTPCEPADRFEDPTEDFYPYPVEECINYFIIGGNFSATELAKSMFTEDFPKHFKKIPAYHYICRQVELIRSKYPDPEKRQEIIIEKCQDENFRTQLETFYLALTKLACEENSVYFFSVADESFWEELSEMSTLFDRGVNPEYRSEYGAKEYYNMLNKSFNSIISILFY